MKAYRRRKDIISALPLHIIEYILVLLPLRDAVRTSILSKKWRYNWATMPCLVFDEELCKRSAGNQLCSKSKIFSAILQVLLLHKGPIVKFTLALNTVERCSGIDQSILYLSRNAVEIFTLKICQGAKYKLPSSFFSFSQLTHLDLQSCVFKPPPTFRCFSMLTTLLFKEIDIASEVLEGFISNCPVLETLHIRSSICMCLKINAPKLHRLYIEYPFKEDVAEEHLEGRRSYCNELFDFVSATVEHLEIGHVFYVGLAVGTIPRNLPKTFSRLVKLKLYDICFEEPHEISFALCLIRSSPSLKSIYFQMFAYAGQGTRSFQPLDSSDIKLSQLVEVTMEDFNGIQPEMEFVKLLLANSPVLVKMQIKLCFWKVNHGMRILKNVTKFPRASPLAEIVFEDPSTSE